MYIRNTGRKFFVSIISNFLQKFLKESGYLAYIALSCEEAISMAYDKIPDCILVDYMLPNAGAGRISQHIKNDKSILDATE